MKSNSGLEGIIDPPLQTSKSTNHNNSSSKSSPQSREPDIPIDGLNTIHSTSSGFNIIQFGNHSVRRMRHNRAEDTSQVTRRESNRKLGRLAVLMFLLTVENVSVEHLNNLLEEYEFHNSVRDLSRPERSESFVEPLGSFGFQNFIESWDESGREGSFLSGLHSHFGGLPWTEEGVCDELSGSGGDDVSEDLVLVDFVSGDSGVDVFEDFVESELSDSLEGVTDEGWAPSEGDSSEPVFIIDLLDSVH